MNPADTVPHPVVSDAEALSFVPTLFVLQGPDKGRTFHASDESTIVGRLSDQVPLTDNSISRHHAELRRDNGEWIIRDHHSSNGTYVNGNRVYDVVPLKHGDQVRMGSTLMVFGAEESTQRFVGSSRTQDLIELAADERSLDSSILASASAGDQSVILASPETSDAVHAWNIVYQFAETLGRFASVNELLEHLTDIIFGHLPVDRIFILMRSTPGEPLKPQVVRYRTPSRTRPSKITTSGRIINHVLHTHEGILCANAQSDSRFGADSKDGSLHRLGLRSVICVPILARGEVVGVIHIDCSMARHTYTHPQLLLATTIGKLAGMAIENAKLIKEQVEHERLAAIGETVAHLSHNIRNILQGLRSGADVIEIGLDKQNLANVRSGWQIVQRNLERTYRLATNMLSFSKQREPLIEMAALNPVLEDVILLTQRQADDKGVMLLTDLEPLPNIPLDLDGIHQVATNIVINALDAAPKNSGRVVVRTQFDAELPAVKLTVTDNGPGIASADMAHVFDAFRSTKGHGGTGLGLAASKKIVEELGGTIQVTCSPEGTSLVVQLATVRTRLADSEKEHPPTARDRSVSPMNPSAPVA